MTLIQRATLSEADVFTHAGFTVHARSATELAVSRGLERWQVHVIRQATSPSARQIAESNALPTGEVFLFVVPRASKRVLSLISEAPRAWLMTGDGHSILADKLPPVHTEKATARGRVPWGRYALMRALLRTPLPRTQQQLAAEVGLTQGAVSVALERLGPLAEKRSNGWVTADPEQVWDAFIAEYPGPGGVRTFWYSRTPFIRQAELLRSLTTLSADGAADELAPWRQPVQIVAYAESPIDMEALGFSPATAAEASVTITMPKDRTVFHTASAWQSGVADTPLAAWDLRASGGPDAEEAVDRLKASVLGALES
ncbi:hypothetical protein ACI1US_02357 [Leucobacter sp. BZR 635]